MNTALSYTTSVGGFFFREREKCNDDYTPGLNLIKLTLILTRLFICLLKCRRRRRQDKKNSKRKNLIILHKTESKNNVENEKRKPLLLLQYI